MEQANVFKAMGESGKKDAEMEMLEQALEARLPEENLTWSTFTENSTFHGVKYIFNSGFVIRR